MPAALRWLFRLVPMNPIVVRLVQGGSRRGRHNLIRSAYLAVLIAVLLTLLLPQQGPLKYQTLAVKGAEAFEIVAYLQIALICILSPVFMAGAIAQESNPRTWEVLLTTPLSAAQMVLGHLFGRLFFVLALLVASMPLFAITQYFGGVPGRSILLSYLVAAGAALLVGSIAVTLAVSRLAGRRAVFTFYVSVITYLAATSAIDFSLQPPGGGVTVVTALNPFLALRALLNPTGYPRPDPVDLEAMSWLPRLWFGDPVGAWIMVTVTISVLLIIVSAFTVRTAGAIEGRSSVLRRGLMGWRGERRARSVWNNPIAWREAAARQATLPKMLARWAFIASGVLWGIGLVAYFHGGGLTPESFRYALLATTWTELIVIVLVAINVSATAISREREDGTLDLLLTTPITPAQYLGGKLRGLISYLAPLLAVPIGTVALASLYTVFDGFGRAGGVTVLEPFGVAMITTPVVLPEGALVALLVAAPFTAFCVMVGLQWSMKSKGTIGSVVATVGAVGVVAGIVGLCGWQAGTNMPVVGPALSASTPLTALLGVFAPGSAFSGSVDTQDDLITARVSLVVGAAIAAVVYMLIVYGIRANLVRTFDMAVRRLAGSR